MKRTPATPIKLSPEQIQPIESAVFSLAEKHLDPGFYLLDVTFEKEAGYWYLRIYVEGRESAVSLSDCEKISRELDPLIEALPVLKDFPYSLEVSSPGVFRPLKKAREFAFYRGRPVKTETQTGKKSKPGAVTALHPPREGILQSFDEARNTAILQETGSGKTFEVSLTEGTVIVLNPEIRFPEEEGGID